MNRFPGFFNGSLPISRDAFTSRKGVKTDMLDPPLFLIWPSQITVAFSLPEIQNSRHDLDLILQRKSDWQFGSSNFPGRSFLVNVFAAYQSNEIEVGTMRVWYESDTTAETKMIGLAMTRSIGDVLAHKVSTFVERVMLRNVKRYLPGIKMDLPCQTPTWTFLFIGSTANSLHSITISLIWSLDLNPWVAIHFPLLNFKFFGEESEMRNAADTVPIGTLLLIIRIFLKYKLLQTMAAVFNIDESCTSTNGSPKSQCQSLQPRIPANQWRRKYSCYRLLKLLIKGFSFWTICY